MVARDHPVEQWYPHDGVKERGLQAHLRFAGMDIPRFTYPPRINVELLDEMPSATLLDNQPGGVRGEFALFGILGALAGSWWGSQR